MTIRMTDATLAHVDDRGTALIYFSDNRLRLRVTSSGRKGYQSPGTFAEIQLIEARGGAVVVAYAPSKGFEVKDRRYARQDLMIRWQIAFAAALDKVSNDRSGGGLWNIMHETSNALLAEMGG